MKKLFFPQRLLDTLASEGTLTIEGNVVTILVRNRQAQTFTLEPAYRILRTVDGSADAAGLVGTIHTEQALRGKGAEIYLDSVVFRDTAYQADPGFIGEEQELMDKLADTELLARYLLENLL